ncbi:hypothetical protein DPX16_13890 [Anabarilius grahami]|uniref:Uncharacterized protein n=1 Tax=Anabarilius grahami TaxID=495550 RepID=A0A3N0XVN8_ANAGA|nr:hypothetical protein DPX16_13890 [Anabarilius grahami]
MCRKSVSCSMKQNAEYDELVELMTRATAKLSLEWSGLKHETASSRLNERYLRSHKCTAPASLPFLPDLHTEVSASWEHPFSARVAHSASNYSYVEGLNEWGSF